MYVKESFVQEVASPEARDEMYGVKTVGWFAA
jgi:hypothetical protein